MTYELYKPYKTRGGWKAVYLGEDKDGHVWAHHTIDRQIIAYSHLDNGQCIGGGYADYDITSEWKEPVLHEGWVNVVKSLDGKFHQLILEQHDTKEDADWCAQDRIACVRIKFTEGEGL